MSEKEKAKVEILKFIEGWFAKQAQYERDEPSAYYGVTKDDWVLWFWESGGEL